LPYPTKETAMHHFIARSFLCLSFVLCVPAIAFAQDAGVATSPFARCANRCSELIASQPEEAATVSEETDLTTQERNIELCAAQIPECAHLTVEDRRALPALCDSLRHGHHGALSFESSPHATPSPPSGFCILPDGTSVANASTLCQCGETAPYAVRVSILHSADRLRSLHLPAGHSAWLCINPYALTGAPGSSDARLAEAEQDITEAFAALDELCHPHEGEALSAACARAYEESRALGSGSGPVDLVPILHAIEGLQANAEAQQEVIDHLVTDSRALQTATLSNSDAIEGVSRRLDALSRCLSESAPQDFDIQTEYLHEDGTLEMQTTHVHCSEVLAAASHEAIEQARAAAREEVARAVSHISVDGGHAFAMLQAYGLVDFNPLTYGNVNYGLTWQVGGELTGGVGLGGGWNFHGGLGIAYGGPNISGATNVAGEARVGIGAFVIPELMIGFGFMATHRFLPDVFSATSLYGGYLDATIRFLPNSEWSPVLTLRLAAGASPRQQGTGWNTQADGLAQILFGIAHF
jgi:hypothetical protein